MITLQELESKYERKVIRNNDPSDDDNDKEHVNDDNGNGNYDDDIIVEDAAVVLSPSERLNQQIRDDMYKNAITVEDDNVVALPDTTTSATKTATVDKEGTHKQRHPFGCDRNWRMILLVIVLLVAIALATIFTVLHFTNKTKNGNTDMSPSTAPTRMKVPVTPSPTSNPTQSPTLPPTTTKFLEMQDLLSAQNLSSSAWFDPESPQYRALNWISNLDNYTINNLEIPVERIVQRYSLATFYYATGGDSEDVEKNQWKKNYNFLSNRSECLWNDGNRGIFCSSQSTKVSTLWIELNQLNGTIPVEIGSLKSLQAMLLWYNNLYGEIPESLYNLDLLFLLGLASNQLSGTISSSLGKLKGMRNINLMRNQFNGTIPSAMAELTNLIAIALDYNQLIGTIPDIFGKNGVTTMNLRQFSMSNNQLHGRVPASIWNISSLQKLAFNGNQLSGELPDTIFLNLQNLDLFNMGSNRFNSSIPSIGAQYLTKMEIFSLVRNELTGTIPSAMEYWEKLTYLNLGGNNLRGEIPSFIGNLTNLRTLMLDGNELTGVVPESFQQLTRLNNLQLSHNLLYGKLDFMDFMCETRKKGGYFAFSADCDGTPPEIICSCCNICCDENDVCYNMVY